jgi:hypothetical protein
MLNGVDMPQGPDLSCISLQEVPTMEEVRSRAWHGNIKIQPEVVASEDLQAAGKQLLQALAST